MPKNIPTQFYQWDSFPHQEMVIELLSYLYKKPENFNHLILLLSSLLLPKYIYVEQITAWKAGSQILEV